MLLSTVHLDFNPTIVRLKPTKEPRIGRGLTRVLASRCGARCSGKKSLAQVVKQIQNSLINKYKAIELHKKC